MSKSSRFFQATVEDESEEEYTSSEEESTDESESEKKVVKKPTAPAKPTTTAAPKKKGFFAASSSEEESEEETESEEESEEESENEKEEEGKAEVEQAKSRFFNASDDTDSDDSTEIRVVKSAKQKLYDQLKSIVDDITLVSIKTETADDPATSIVNADWVATANNFEALNKLMEKYKKLEDVNPRKLPLIYLSILLIIEAIVTSKAEGVDASKKKLSKIQQKAFNAFTQKLKKFNAQPDIAAQLEPLRKQTVNLQAAEEQDITDMEPTQAVEETPEKTTTGEQPAEQKTTGKNKQQITKQPVVGQEEESDEEDETMIWNDEVVDNKLRDLIAARGKLGTDRRKQIEQLKRLLNKAEAPAKFIEVAMHLLSALFDFKSGMLTHMPLDLWRSCHENLIKMTIVLEKYPEIDIIETEVSNQGKEGKNKVYGNLLSVVEKLDDEHLKSLQFTDPRLPEYITRLEDEHLLIDVLERTMGFYEVKGLSKYSARVAARLFEHVYYRKYEDHETMFAKHQEITKQMHAQLTKRIKYTQESSKPFPNILVSDLDALLGKLSSLIFDFGNERTKTRTMLGLVYSNSVHDRFYQARDMLMMSHVQDNVGGADVPTQILYNRCLAQLGLCAFRSGMHTEAHSCLQDVCSNQPRLRELIGQGVSSPKFGEKKPEQERLEKSRMVPFNTHINIDMLEGVHLLCAMILEIPNMAANFFDPRKNIISKPLRRFLDYYEKQVFSGPPENTRELITSACRALYKCEWEAAFNFVSSLNLWNHLTNTLSTHSHISSADQIKDAIKQKIQEEGLRTYMFLYSQCYESIKVDNLSQMFSLPTNRVHSILSKMMANEEIRASWYPATGCIIMHKVEPSKLQFLALQFSDKAAVLVESNEKFLDQKTGGYSKQDKSQKDGAYQARFNKNRQSNRPKDNTRGQQQQQFTPYR